MKYLITIILSVTMVGLACNIHSIKDKYLLYKFKNGTEAQKIEQCLGDEGTVDYQIFDSINVKNKKSKKIIEAHLQNGKFGKDFKEFVIQYSVNKNTDKFTLAFAGDPGEKNQLFIFSHLYFQLFCLQNGVNIPNSTSGI